MRNLNRRTSLIAIMATMVLALSWFAVVGRERYVELLPDRQFRSDELAILDAAFARAGLSHYTIQDGRVTIASREKGSFLRAVEEAELLPRSLGASMSDAISAAHPFESIAQRNARLKLAGEQELSSYIRALKDIEDATVRFDEVERPGLNAVRNIRAMVIVKPVPGELLVPERLQMIGELVAASRVGMSPEDVTILDLESGQTFRVGASLTPAQRVAQWDHRKRTYEAHWSKKIAASLSFVPKISVITEMELVPESLAPLGLHVVLSVPEGYYQAVCSEQQKRAGSDVHEPSEVELAEVHREVNEGLEQFIHQLIPTQTECALSCTVTIRVVPDIITSTPSNVERWRAPNSMVAGLIAIMFAGALVALVGFAWDLGRSFLRTAAATEVDPHPVRGAANASVPARESADESPESVPTQDEFAKLARTHPEVVAATLRHWIDPAA